MNYGPLAKKHPHYIFGETSKKYKSLGLTTEPSSEYPYVRLKHNPNPDDDRPSYLQLAIHTGKKEYYGDYPLIGWKFSPEDMPAVRNRIKRYKVV